MNKSFRYLILATIVATIAAVAIVRAQQGALTAAEKTRRWDTENELQSLATVERKVMMPMPDGVRLATDIYRPKNATGKVPAIWVRTPYNFNFWDVHNGVPADMTAALTAVKRGYAYVVQNERGHFFSEGNYDILGAPRSDGYNAVDWLTKQSWSNGKLGTTGCSSTAEYQMAIAALGHPGYAAMNTQGFGAGVGRVGPYYEQGNWYRGGAVQMLFVSWIYGEQNQVRPMFPPNTSREDLIRASKSFDLAQHLPPVDWSKALWHLPVQDILKEVDAPHGIYADAMPVETGGKMIQRTPNDAAWYRGGLVHDDMKNNARLASLPKVTYFTMGINKWQTADTWPPAGAQPITLYLTSAGKANSLAGDGALTSAAPDADKPDSFTYDPMNPVLSYGGNVCCTGNAVQAGAFDQRRMEARDDILVYTTEPFKEGTEVSGPITPTLYVSSDAKDTDVTVKVLDVYPDGRAYNLDESIQRMRYRDGYDKPIAWMESGKVYKVTLQPLTTSNYFGAGHRLRIEVSSSNFPRFDRNLNTGGNNYDESKGIVAHNAVHHSKQYPSQITVTVVKRGATSSAPAR